MKSSQSYPNVSARQSSSATPLAKDRHVLGDVSSHAPQAHLPIAGVRRAPVGMHEARHSGARPVRSAANAHRSPSDLALAERMLQRLKLGAGIRIDKVDRVRNTLACGGYEGAYETELALEVVAERLLEDLMV